MLIKKIITLALIFSSTQLISQVQLDDLDDVKEYIEGEWQLKYLYTGFAGNQTYFPTNSLDYRFNFDLIEGNDSTILATGILNGQVL